MRIHQIILVVVSSCIFAGCATVFKGYYSRVELNDAPDSLRVYTAEGVEIPVTKTVLRVQLETVPQKWVDKPTSVIELRSKYDYVLVLRNQNQEKIVQVFGKIGGGWLVLSTVCFIVPAVVDGLTGNWNSYDAIDASFK